MFGQSKTKVKLWQLLLAIIVLSFALAWFPSERFALTAVVVIEVMLLLGLAILYRDALVRW